MLVFSQLRHTTGSKPGEHNDNMVIMVMVIMMVMVIIGNGNGNDGNL